MSNKALLAAIPEHVLAECVFRSTQRRRGLPQVVSCLGRVIREWQPSLIHCSLARASLASRIAGAITHTSVVESLVNVGYEPERLLDHPHVSRWKLSTYRRVDVATMRRVRLFHAVSQAVADSWARTADIPREKMRVIPRGVDVRKLQSAAADGPRREELLSSLGVPPNSVVLLSVGRQEAQKGHRYLLEALALLGQKEGMPAFLLLAGREGSLTQAILRAVANLSIGDRVRVLGYRADVPALLQAADIFLFPSLHEGMPGALLEAMALGLPCVAADIPPVLEIMAHGVEGLAVPSRNPSALADAVATLVGDIDRRRALGAAARKRVLRDFSAQVAADRLELFYREALAAAPDTS